MLITFRLRLYLIFLFSFQEGYCFTEGSFFLCPSTVLTDVVEFKPIPAYSLPFKPWPGMLQNKTAYWGVWLSDWQEGFRNTGKSNQKEGRQTEKEEPRTEKHWGKFLQETVECYRDSLWGNQRFLPIFPGNTLSRKLVLVLVLVFRWADDKKRGGEEGKNSVENWNEEKDRKEIKCTMKISRCGFNGSTAHQMLVGSAELPRLD